MMHEQPVSGLRSPVSLSLSLSLSLLRIILAIFFSVRLRRIGTVV